MWTMDTILQVPVSYETAESYKCAYSYLCFQTNMNSHKCFYCDWFHWIVCSMGLIWWLQSTAPSTWSTWLATIWPVNYKRRLAWIWTRFLRYWFKVLPISVSLLRIRWVDSEHSELFNISMLLLGLSNGEGTAVETFRCPKTVLERAIQYILHGIMHASCIYVNCPMRC